MLKHVICLSTALLLSTSFSYANVVKVQKLNQNIYVLFGQGGNIAASIGEDGIYIVDDQFAKLSDDIKMLIPMVMPLYFLITLTSVSYTHLTLPTIYSV